jgi:hypothetical protein
VSHPFEKLTYTLLMPWDDSPVPKISLSDVNCRSATLVDGFEQRDQHHQEVTFLGLGGPLSAPAPPPPSLSLSFSSLPTSPTSPRSNPSSRPTTKAGRSAKITLGSARPVHNVALKRLSRDLTWSVPIVLVLSVFCMVSGPFPLLHCFSGTSGSVQKLNDS